MVDQKPKARPCQWCGEDYHSTHPAKLYCSPQCKNNMGNFFTVVGKRICADAMLWRRRRGKVGAPAEAMKRLSTMLDRANEEFRTSRPKGAPSIDEYVAASNAPNQIRKKLDQ